MNGRLLDVARGDAVDFPIPSIPIPQTTKHPGGYRLSRGMDWIDLFVGSEGTLGVVLEAELRLLPAPAEILAGVVFFRDDFSAVAAVEEWRRITEARMLEYLDHPSIRLLRARFPEVPHQSCAILFEEAQADADIWLDRLTTSGARVESSWFATTP